MGGKRDYELLLEIGHKSKPLKKKAANGYTHKWTVYLKGVDDAKIEHCISRVVFQLHESFDNHHRVITEPPYRVKETGYAGFELPIEVYFRNKDKPNPIVYVHNLELLNTEKHVSSHVEKVRFLNPNKDFEKCLIRTGAQAYVSKSKGKRDRSDSPAVKKRKSASSLIPSKDMGKLNLQPNSNGNQNNNNSGTHQSSSHNNHSSSQQTSKLSQQHNHSHSHHSINGTNGSSNSNGRSNHSHTSSHSGNSSHHQPNSHTNSYSQTSKHNNNHHQQQQQQQQKPSVPKVKSESKDFVDLFGPPLVYNKKRATSNPDHFQNLQTTITGLTDCDRLQKIVDIIEESGEWFNLTPKKFEFDLKRLDKKTLHKIEKCLH